MKQAERRLNRVEDGLSGREMTLAEIRAALEYPSVDDSTRAMMEDLHAPSLCDRIGDSIVAAMKGQDARHINRIVREQQAEALFLIHLWTECNSWIAEEQRPSRLLRAWLASQLHVLLLMRKDGSTSAERRDEHIARLREHVSDSLADVYRLRFSINWISQTYFQGQRILWDDTAAMLNTQIDELLGTADLFNGIVENVLLSPGGIRDIDAVPFIDAEAVEKSARKSLRITVATIVDKARGAAFVAMGDHEGAASVYGPHLAERAARTALAKVHTTAR